MDVENSSKLVELANSLCRQQTGRQLKNIQKEILRQILIGKKYEDIELDKSKFPKAPGNSTIKGYWIPKTWDHLSEAFGKPIGQNNIKDELEKLQSQNQESRGFSWLRVIVNRHIKLKRDTVVSRSILGKTEKIYCLNSEGTSQNTDRLNNSPVSSNRLALNGQQFNIFPDAEEQKGEDDNAAEQTQAEFHGYSYKVVKTDSTNSTSCWRISMRLMKSGLALLIALGVYSSWYGFYWLANWYGVKSHAEGKLPQAQSAYNWALKLDPLNLWSAEAHYNLGGLHEDQQNYQQAQAEYQRAMELGRIEAYNNQARLYILKGNYSAAVVLLQFGIRLTRNEDPEDRYNFFKNLGWVRLEQGSVEEAQVQLEQAIAMQGDRAAAYCLLAQVLERRGKNKQAVSHWEDCIAYTHLPRTPEEDKWIRLGQQRLKAAYGEFK